MVPNTAFSPAAWVAARLSAWPVASGSRPSRRAQPAAAPNAPIVPVVWNPLA